MSSFATDNPLKRPLPTRAVSSSSSDIQLVPSDTTEPAAQISKDEGKASKENKSPEEPRAKKPKLGLVKGAGAQTMLNFSAPKTDAKTPTKKVEKVKHVVDAAGENASVGDSSSKSESNASISKPPPNPFLLSSSSKPDNSKPLTDAQKKLLQMELTTMGPDWLEVLQSEMKKPYFLELKRFVIAEQAKNKVFPPAQDVYSWTRFCPLKGIRVVIIGQDPYHNDNQAHGLAFSVRKGIAVPPSLRNMYKELENEYPDFKAPKHGDLSSWAKQGVLLLNTSLTVRAHEANSHSKKGWEQFTERVLKLIVERLSEKGEEPGAKGVVFLAWGAGAGKLVKGISQKQHHVLTSVHPSPLSAMRGFMGNNHFKKCNDWLEERYGAGNGIDWTSVMRD